MTGIRGVVFDLDGTLADTASLSPGRRVPWHVLEQVRTDAQHALRFRLNEMDAGVPQIVAEFIAAGLKVAIVTRSPRAYASTLLWHLGCDFHVLRAGGPGGEPQAKKRVADAIADLGLTPAEVVYIGDRLEDLVIAKSLGCRYFAPFWCDLMENSLSLPSELYAASDSALAHHSETLRHLYDYPTREMWPMPEYQLDVVLTRFQKGLQSVIDAEWLQESTFAYWKAKLLPHENTSDMGATVPEPWPATPSREQENAVFEFADRALREHDWARLALLDIEQVRWYARTFPDSTKRASDRSIFEDVVSSGGKHRRPTGQSIVTNSALAGMCAAKALPDLVDRRVPTMTWIVDDVHAALTRSADVAVRSGRAQITLGTPLEMSSGVHPGLHAPTRHEAESPVLKPAVSIPSGFDGYALRNDYDFNLWALKRMLQDARVLPKATDVTALYTDSLRGCASPRIFAFIPYRAPAGEVCGEAFWHMVKNWKYQGVDSGASKPIASGPEIHLHYLEAVALAMAAHILAADPDGNRKIVATPASLPTLDRPACISMRLARRVGQLLLRDVFYPLEKSSQGLSASREWPRGAWNGAFLIDDQVTTSKTYLQACSALNSSLTLLAWSSSRLSTGNSAARDYQWK